MPLNPVNVLVLEGASNHSLAVLRALSKVPEIALHVLCSEHFVLTRFSKHWQSFVRTASLPESSSYLDVIHAAVKKCNAHLLLPVVEPTIRFAAEYLPQLRELAAVAPVPNVRSFDIVSDKWQFAEFLRERGISQPISWYFEDIAALRRGLDELPFPVLAKPRKGSGGKEITLCRTPAELIRLYEDQPELAARCLIQAYFDGTDIDCSVLCRDGEVLAHTIQQAAHRPGQGFAPARGLRFLRNAEVFERSRSVLAALQWNGVAHLDLRIDAASGEVKVIELNPRFWATLLGSLEAGINFPHLACLTGLNQAFPAQEYREGTFLSGREAFRHAVRKPFLVGKAHEQPMSDLRFMVEDPLPALCAQAQRAKKIIVRKFDSLRAR